MIGHLSVLAFALLVEYLQSLQKRCGTHLFLLKASFFVSCLRRCLRRHGHQVIHPRAAAGSHRSSKENAEVRGADCSELSALAKNELYNKKERNKKSKKKQKTRSKNAHVQMGKHHDSCHGDIRLKIDARETLPVALYRDLCRVLGLRDGRGRVQL